MSRHSSSEHFRVHGAVLNLFDKSPPLDMQTGDLQPCGPRAEYDWLSIHMLADRFSKQRRPRHVEALHLPLPRTQGVECHVRC